MRYNIYLYSIYILAGILSNLEVNYVYGKLWPLTCKFYAVLYTELEHPWILMSEWFLELIFLDTKVQLYLKSPFTFRKFWRINSLSEKWVYRDIYPAFPLWTIAVETLNSRWGESIIFIKMLSLLNEKGLIKLNYSILPTSNKFLDLGIKYQQPVTGKRHILQLCVFW
jgi:hypothetical protein